MDFVHDALESGRGLRALNVLDSYSRGCVPIEVGHTLAGGDVTRVLERLVAERGRPAQLRSDHGPEFTSRRFLARRGPLRGCGKNSSTCHDDYVGTTDKKGVFHRTHLTGNQTADAALGKNGISVKYGGSTYEGVWDTNKGEQTWVTVATGIAGLTATAVGNCEGTCVVGGFLGLTANAQVSQIAFRVLSGAPGWQENPGLDPLDIFHPGEVNFRGYVPSEPEGLPSTHVPVPSKPREPVGWHVDGRYPYEDVAGFVEHAGSVVHTLFNDLLGAAQ